MKIKIDVNLELGLVEYDQQQTDAPAPQQLWTPSCTEMTGHPESAQPSSRPGSRHTVH
jgi:hypothetical protein